MGCKGQLWEVIEAFLVDPSKHMNDLTRLVIGVGDEFRIPDATASPSVFKLRSVELLS